MRRYRADVGIFNGRYWKDHHIVVKGSNWSSAAHKAVMEAETVDDSATDEGWQERCLHCRRVFNVCEDDE